MARTLETGGTLIVASHNQGKVREIRDLLAPFGITVQSAADLNLPEPEETEDSFIGNAKLKALAAAQSANLPALSDDSGLAVTALGGAPGNYSARRAGERKEFALAMDRVHTELGDTADRSAAFVCALCLAWPDGHSETFEGRVEGSIVWPMRGERGFGYDPVFVPDGHSVTFAEMDPSEKHSMSHRARAFAQMVEACF
jgi:XTP/dITP diphosphohydrolase